ncbi:MAG: hypothetical protein Q9181_003901 [Wetmoreana brouardii]
MAELMAVSASILSALQYANSLYRLTKALHQTDDPRIKLLKYRLVTQRQMVMAWANRVRSGESESWDIPPESAFGVEQILREMKSYFERAERKMDKIYRTPDSKMTWRIFAQRFWFSVDGYQELTDLTDALDAMNRALLVIAPSLPPQAQHQNKLTSTDADRSSANHSRFSRSHVEPSSLEDLEATPSRMPISALHSHCVDALGVLLDFSDQRGTFADELERLNRWACGLLTGGVLSLDTAFSQETDKYAELEAVITRILIHVAAVEESILRQLCDGDTSNQRRLHRQHMQILAVLGADQFNEFALEYWSDIVARKREQQVINTRSSENAIIPVAEEGKHVGNPEVNYAIHQQMLSNDQSKQFQDLEEVEQESEVLAETASILLSQTQSEESDNESLEESAMSFNETQTLHLSHCIGFLFDLLPAIRRVRRQRVLEIEAQERISDGDRRNDGVASSIVSVSNKKDAGTSETVESLDITLEQLLDHSLTLASSLETILRNDEMWARKNNRKVQAYSGMLQVEVDRLNAFKDRSAASKSLGEAGMKSVVDTISTLSEALHQAIKDVSISEQPAVGEKDGSRFRLVDAKFAKSNVDQTIKEVIQQFSASNKAMWLQSTNLQPTVSIVAA